MEEFKNAGVMNLIDEMEGKPISINLIGSISTVLCIEELECNMCQGGNGRYFIRLQEGAKEGFSFDIFLDNIAEIEDFAEVEETIYIHLENNLTIQICGMF